MQQILISFCCRWKSWFAILLYLFFYLRLVWRIAWAENHLRCLGRESHRWMTHRTWTRLKIWRRKKMKKNFYFEFLSADKLSIINYYHGNGFYKPTLPLAGLQHLKYARFYPCLDPKEWCMKNGFLSGGLNPRPFNHESSCLTTRPRLLAKKP